MTSRKRAPAPNPHTNTPFSQMYRVLPPARIFSQRWISFSVMKTPQRRRPLAPHSQT